MANFGVEKSKSVRNKRDFNLHKCLIIQNVKNLPLPHSHGFSSCVFSHEKRKSRKPEYSFAGNKDKNVFIFQSFSIAPVDHTANHIGNHNVGSNHSGFAHDHKDFPKTEHSHSTLADPNGMVDGMMSSAFGLHPAQSAHSAAHHLSGLAGGAGGGQHASASMLGGQESALSRMTSMTNSLSPPTHNHGQVCEYY